MVLVVIALFYRSLGRRCGTRGPLFPNGPETFGAYFVYYILTTKASQGTILCNYFNFYCLDNMWKDQAFENKLFGAPRMTFRSLSSRCQLRQDTSLHVVSLHPGCINGYRRYTEGGNPDMD